MKINLFKTCKLKKNLLEKDVNGREINIYKINNVCLTGHSVFYPNVLLKSKNELILPLLERTMSLKSGTIYENQNMEYQESKIQNEINNEINIPLFFFKIGRASCRERV